MPQNSQTIDNLHTRRIDKVFFESWDSKPEQWPNYAHNKKGEFNNHTTQLMAGIDQWTKRKTESDNATRKNITQGPLIMKEYEEFDIEVEMTRAMIDDDQWNIVEGMAADAGRAGRETVERDTVSLLDEAFTVNQYDGVPLCSDSHPFISKEVSGVQSNLATGALTDDNLRAGITLFNDQRDESGKVIHAEPTKLIVRHNQQWQAAVILESVQVSGTANNDKNPLPELRVVKSNYMSSPTAWFLQSDEHQLLHIWRVMPEFYKKQYREDNFSQKWLGYFRHATKVDNWHHFVGSTGV